MTTAPKNEEARKQEAATKWAMEQITRNGAAGLDEAVLFGIAWRDKNPAPELLLLRQLEAELLNYSAGVIFMTQERPREILKALAEYRAARGK